MKKPNVYISHPFRVKDPGAPDCWRIGIWKRGRGMIAYATGGDEAEVKANARLLVEAFGCVFTLPDPV